jgi:hypothetical protein
VQRHQRVGKDHVRNNDGGRRGDGRDNDDGSINVSSGTSRHHRCSGKGRCFNCGVRDHFSRECTKPRKEVALLADVDDESMLL